MGFWKLPTGDTAKPLKRSPVPQFSIPMCDHRWEFLATVYSMRKEITKNEAKMSRAYKDRYYCTKCLEYRERNERNISTLYGNPVEGTKPE